MIVVSARPSQLAVEKSEYCAGDYFPCAISAERYPLLLVTQFAPDGIWPHRHRAGMHLLLGGDVF
jgi:hypothetical protein